MKERKILIRTFRAVSTSMVVFGVSCFLPSNVEPDSNSLTTKSETIVPSFQKSELTLRLSVRCSDPGEINRWGEENFPILNIDASRVVADTKYLSLTVYHANQDQEGVVNITNSGPGVLITSLKGKYPFIEKPGLGEIISGDTYQVRVIKRKNNLTSPFDQGRIIAQNNVMIDCSGLPSRKPPLKTR